MHVHVRVHVRVHIYANKTTHRYAINVDYTLHAQPPEPWKMTYESIYIYKHAGMQQHRAGPPSLRTRPYLL